jgi:hypothetical protein
MKRAVPTLILLLAALTATSCAVRVGGGGPREYDVVALRADAGAQPGAVAGIIGAAGADIVLLSAERDTAWFMAVAAESGFELSGPAASGPVGLAFLTRLEQVGDTSLVLNVPGGGRIHMQDALYRTGGGRFIDLMAIRFEGDDVRAAVRRLLDYIATDVMAQVPVLLAVDAPTPAQADSVAVLMRAYYASEVDCRDTTIVHGASQSVRLLYGPSARITCRSSRPLPAQVTGAAARVVTGR